MPIRMVIDQFHETGTYPALYTGEERHVTSMQSNTVMINEMQRVGRYQAMMHQSRSQVYHV
jgi:hypothetical protein